MNVALLAVAHEPTHEPILAFESCWVCRQALSATWARLAPEFRDVEVAEIVRRLRRALLEIEVEL